MTNILITSGGGLWISNLSKLLYTKYNIFLTDSNLIKKPTYVTKVFKIPLSSHKNFYKRLKSISRINNIDYIIPSSDEEAIFLSKKKKLFEKNIKTRILISDYLSIKKFIFKHQIYKILKKKKLISYNWYLIKNRSKLINTID